MSDETIQINNGCITLTSENGTVRVFAEVTPESNNTSFRVGPVVMGRNSAGEQPQKPLILAGLESELDGAEYAILEGGNAEGVWAPLGRLPLSEFKAFVIPADVIKVRAVVLNAFGSETGPETGL